MNTPEYFDKSDEYEQMLDSGLKYTGESKEYFALERLKTLHSMINRPKETERILDFGCGIGSTTNLLKKYFSNAEVLGIDTSESAIKYANRSCRADKTSFTTVDQVQKNSSFDLVHCNGVFHHIEPIKRKDALLFLRSNMAKKGRFAFFENNPINPGTRWVMSRIPFDRDAQPIFHRTAINLVQSCGFRLVAKPVFLFYFPASLSWLRPTEQFLKGFPLGGQYLLLFEVV